MRAVGPPSMLGVAPWRATGLPRSRAVRDAACIALTPRNAESRQPGPRVRKFDNRSPDERTTMPCEEGARKPKASILEDVCARGCCRLAAILSIYRSNKPVGQIFRDWCCRLQTPPLR